MNIRDFILDR